MEIRELIQEEVQYIDPNEYEILYLQAASKILLDKPLPKEWFNLSPAERSRFLRNNAGRLTGMSHRSIVQELIQAADVIREVASNICHETQKSLLL